MRPKGTAEELERRRRRAVALVEEGWSMRDAAKAVGASPGSVSTWYATYQKHGDAGLAAKAHPGRPPELTPRQLKELETLLSKGAAHQGYPNELWTLRRVAALIEKEFGVSYDPSGVWHVLRRMGWSAQKPERRARERDERAIETWRKKDWPRIKKSAEKGRRHRSGR